MKTPLAICLLLLASAAGAQQSCPCVPLSHLWIVKTCADWTCASTELVLANGDPQVIAIPVALDDARWLIVRRFTAGAAIDVTNDPFTLKQFDGMTAAVDQYNAVSSALKPILLSAPDGQVLVISLKEPPRRRAVAH
jgi:hypothetical protein